MRTFTYAGLVVFLTLILAATAACEEGNSDQSASAADTTEPATSSDSDARPVVRDSAYVRAVRRLVEESPPAYVDEEAAQRSLQRFYQNTGYGVAWSTAEASRPAAGRFVDALQQVHRHGLDPSDYGSTELAERTKRLDAGSSPSPEDVAALDLLLTYRFMEVGHHLVSGRIPPERGPEWYTSPRDIDLVRHLERVLDGTEVEAVMVDLVPPHDGYRRLEQALQRHQRIADEGGWNEVPAGDLLAVGDTSRRVIPLAERLAITGDLQRQARRVDSVFTREIAAALAGFQQRHALAVDSLLGENTLAALNVPVEDRIQAITLNLERWRWLPDTLGTPRHLVVNVPEYRLRGYRDDENVIEMAVVVGKEYQDRNTPIFSDEMDHLIFSPYWNIPQSIASDEILPEARRNLDYLAANGYEVVSSYGPGGEVYEVTPATLDRVASGDLRLRQKPGPQNSLGLVKFMFPNQYSIYLHDTPADYLFERTDRAFSHGCIRVERPKDLAEWVLQNEEDWDRQRIDEAMHDGEWQRVEVADPIPVYILYWTARVQEDGTVQFFDDIYGYDAAFAQLLDDQVSV